MEMMTAMMTGDLREAGGRPDFSARPRKPEPLFCHDDYDDLGVTCPHCSKRYLSLETRVCHHCTAIVERDFACGACGFRECECRAVMKEREEMDKITDAMYEKARWSNDRGCSRTLSECKLEDGGVINFAHFTPFRKGGIVKPGPSRKLTRLFDEVVHLVSRGVVKNATNK